MIQKRLLPISIFFLIFQVYARAYVATPLLDPKEQLNLKVVIILKSSFHLGSYIRWLRCKQFFDSTFQLVSWPHGQFVRFYWSWFCRNQICGNWKVRLEYRTDIRRINNYLFVINSRVSLLRYWGSKAVLTGSPSLVYKVRCMGNFNQSRN